MAIGDLNPASWRIEIYDIRQTIPFSGYITDLSNLYTSELSVKKQRNYPDEITFTLDLAQLQARADLLGVDVHAVLEPYMHNVKVFRDNKFMAQGIVTKTSVNLNNESKNTIEVSCVDILGILEKRLIHQDYGEGSWADFAKEVIMDAQHEPNRIYNYAFEGDGIAIDNAWFRGWKFQPGDTTRDLFPDWEPNHLYSMYDRCNHDGKFWEAKEHAFYSGETFSESNWTLLGILDDETGDVAAAYAVWREDDVDPGPTGTHLGGWGGTSSCHMSGATMNINNGGDVTSIAMAGSEVSTSLVAPYSFSGGNRLYSRGMFKNISGNSKVKFFIEGYGGSPKVYSEEYTVTGTTWKKVEKYWNSQAFDVYRFGVKVTSGDLLFDSPAIYQAPVEGDVWDLGIRPGLFPTNAEQTEAGWLKNRHSPTYEWKNAKATLLDLSNMDSDNFWYEVDENYKFNIRVNAGSDMVNVELSYPRNITSMSVSTDAGSIVNYVKGDGSAEVKQDPLVSGTYVGQPAPFTWVGMNQKSMQEYWALASSERFDSERTIDSLKSDIASLIQTNANIQDVPTIKIENNAVSPAAIALGDIVSVSTIGIPYVKRANGLYKIVAYDIDVDIDGNESLSITLLNPTETQINALSFPQLVKNLINRVKG